MLRKESLTGNTKHAESCPWGMCVPAFMRVGELGRNSRDVMVDRNFSSISSTSAGWAPNAFSTEATAWATLRNMDTGVSMVVPSSSLRR